MQKNYLLLNPELTSKAGERLLDLIQFQSSCCVNFIAIIFNESIS